MQTKVLPYPAVARRKLQSKARQEIFLLKMRAFVRANSDRSSFGQSTLGRCTQKSKTTGERSVGFSGAQDRLRYQSLLWQRARMRFSIQCLAADCRPSVCSFPISDPRRDCDSSTESARKSPAGSVRCSKRAAIVHWKWLLANDLLGYLQKSLEIETAYCNLQ